MHVDCCVVFVACCLLCGVLFVSSVSCVLRVDGCVLRGAWCLLCVAC